MSAKLIVRTNNVLSPPLLETDEASIIEFRDSFGDLQALMIRIFTEDLWGLVTKNDFDWEATLVRYCFLNVSKPVKDLIKNGL